MTRNESTARQPMRQDGRGFERTDAQVWRPDEAPIDTAPDAPESVDTSAWSTPPDRADSVLATQMCPVCGEGPWKSPLNHVSRKHGIDRFTMRDLCGLSTNDRVVDPELSERFAENNRGRDMTAVTAAAIARAGQPRRSTAAGRARNGATLRAFNETPEALEQKRSAALASKSPEAKAKWAASMRARP